MKNNHYYNQSGKYDPTAGRALDKIVKEEEKAGLSVREPKKNKRRRKRKKNRTQSNE